MSTPRQTPHRPTRSGRNARQRADLKRQNHRLEQELSRLQEAAEKAPRPRSERRKKEVAVVAQVKNPCPTCGLELRLVSLGRLDVWACGGCHWHRPA